MKKLFALILSASMILSLAACSNPNQSEPAPTTLAEGSLADKSDDDLRAMMKDF